MAEAAKPARRIAKVAKELNVSSATIVEHLTSNGFDVVDKPTTKLSEDMYTLLLKEFQKDKFDKERAAQIDLGGLRREDVELERGQMLKGKRERETEEVVIHNRAGIVESQEEASETPPAPEPKPKAEPKPEPAPVAEKPKPEPEPKKEEPKPAEPAKAEKPEPKAEQPKKPVEEPKPAEAKKEEDNEDTTVRAKAPRIGVTLKGKVDLDAGKKSAAKKEEVKQPEEPIEEIQPEPTPEPTSEVAKADPPAEKAPQPDAEPAAEEDSVTPTKRVELKGTKVIGKIDLPVQEPKKKPVASSSEDTPTEKKKRRRRRIRKDGTEAPEGGNERGRGRRKDDEKKEISEKEIQEQIKSTMARLGATSQGRARSRIRRAKRESMHQAASDARDAIDDTKLQVTEFITVAELAGLLDVGVSQVIGTCMNLGIVVTINQRLDAEVIELVVDEYGFTVEFIDISEEEDEEIYEDDPADLRERAPIVTIMGHVDHGKTSLLDYIREANVIAGEVGGITQHIGAYEVSLDNGKEITFLDTPGHEAFTAMRARGTKITDVAVIVISADDAVMPQTKEAISHAQAAGVPMIFAFNKIDKDGADPERIKGQLSEMNILVEDWGGDFQSQEISAKKGTNVDQLLEKILLQAEMLDLKANPDKPALGTVLEAELDKGRGIVATILIQEGTLKTGDMVVAGSCYGKVRAMFDERGKRKDTAGPATPVQLLGLNGAPAAGEKFRVFESEGEAKQLANRRAQIEREQGMRAQKHITLDEIGRRLALGNFQELNLVIKGDFDGSVEALKDSLLKLSTDEIQIKVIHSGVGQITESDVLLASASDAIIIGFQVRPSLNARKLAEKESIDIRLYSIIYDAIEELKSAMEGMLEPKIEEQIVGNIEIRDVFKISKVGTVAGCYVLDGKFTRNTKIRLVREGIVVFTGELSSLKRYKEDVKEVKTGLECGITIANYNDIKVGDVIEGYEEVAIERKL